MLRVSGERAEQPDVLLGGVDPLPVVLADRDHVEEPAVLDLGPVVGKFPRPGPGHAGRQPPADLLVDLLDLVEERITPVREHVLLLPDGQVPARPQRFPSPPVPHARIHPVPRGGREHQADRLRRPPVLESPLHHLDVEPGQIPARHRGQLAAQLHARDPEAPPGQRQRGLARGAARPPAAGHPAPARPRRSGHRTAPRDSRAGPAGRSRPPGQTSPAAAPAQHRTTPGQYKDLPGQQPAASWRPHLGPTMKEWLVSAGVVLAGGRSSRMGTPKAALEWHGSTLLRRTVGIVARATSGPVVVVRAPGQDLPELPEGTLVADDPREGKGPVQGIAAGLAALSGRAEVAFIGSTDMPFLHPAFIRRVLRVARREQSHGCRPAGRPRVQAAAGRRVSRLARGNRGAPGQGGPAAARLPLRASARWKRWMMPR